MLHSHHIHTHAVTHTHTHSHTRTHTHTHTHTLLLQGDYTISPRGTPTMLNSFMYKLSYWDFGNIMTEHNQPTGFDRVRGTEIGE